MTSGQKLYDYVALMFHEKKKTVGTDKAVMHLSSYLCWFHTHIYFKV